MENRTNELTEVVNKSLSENSQTILIEHNPNIETLPVLSKILNLSHTRHKTPLGDLIDLKQTVVWVHLTTYDFPIEEDEKISKNIIYLSNNPDLTSKLLEICQNESITLCAKTFVRADDENVLNAINEVNSKLPNRINNIIWIHTGRETRKASYQILSTCTLAFKVDENKTLCTKSRDFIPLDPEYYTD